MGIFPTISQKNTTREKQSFISEKLLFKKGTSPPSLDQRYSWVMNQHTVNRATNIRRSRGVLRGVFKTGRGILENAEPRRRQRGLMVIHANEYHGTGIGHWASVFVTSLVGIVPSISQKTRNTQGIHANEYHSMGIGHWASVFDTSSLVGKKSSHRFPRTQNSLCCIPYAI